MGTSLITKAYKYQNAQRKKNKNALLHLSERRNPGAVDFLGYEDSFNAPSHIPSVFVVRLRNKYIL